MGLWPLRMGDDVVEVVDADDLEAVDDGCLAGVSSARRGTRTEGAGADGDGERALDGEDGAVEAELADEHVALLGLGGDVAVGGEQGDGDGRVEAEPSLRTSAGARLTTVARMGRLKPWCGWRSGRARRTP
jgi:hypothetical protein